MLAPNDERMNALRARWQGVQQWLESSLRLPPQARGQWTWPRLDVPRLRGWSTAGVNWFTNTHAANMRRIQGLPRNASSRAATAMENGLWKSLTDNGPIRHGPKK